MENDYIQQNPDSGEKDKQKESILSYLVQKTGSKLQELNKEIFACQKEIEVLEAEVELLENTENQTDLFMEYAQNQSRKAADNIDYLISQEMAQIENDGRTISDSHKQKIVELDTKMQLGIQYAYKIMNEMLEKQNQAEKHNRTEQPAISPVIEAAVRIEERIASKEAVNQEIQPVREKYGEGKIIEGFWEEPKIEEIPVTKTEAQIQDNVAGIKNMYVIGKVAGEDLFDKSGKLIIAKNETIILDVINKAEREGKLIELVLEMKLQEG